MSDDKPYKSLSGEDIRRVFHNREVIPLEPIKMEIRCIPIDEFMKQMCSICPCGNPRKFFEELAEIRMPPVFEMLERDVSLDKIQWDEEDEKVFRRLQAIETPSEDS